MWGSKKLDQSQALHLIVVRLSFGVFFLPKQVMFRRAA
jgi:hypothetical protein